MYPTVLIDMIAAKTFLRNDKLKLTELVAVMCCMQVFLQQHPHCTFHISGLPLGKPSHQIEALTKNQIDQCCSAITF
jgi:hypothetical protein